MLNTLSNLFIFPVTFPYRWIDGNTLLSSSLYANWDGGSATVTNQGAYDCVKFSGNGWRVHDAYCDSSKLPFLCRQRGRSTIYKVSPFKESF